MDNDDFLNIDNIANRSSNLFYPKRDLRENSNNNLDFIKKIFKIVIYIYYYEKKIKEILNKNDKNFYLIKSDWISELKKISEYEEKSKIKAGDAILNAKYPAAIHATTFKAFKLPINTNFIGFTNIVMYNNRNMTLPVGMHESNQILIDYDKLNINQINNNQINIEYLENEKDDFSNIITRKINVLEFEANSK